MSLSGKLLVPKRMAGDMLGPKTMQDDDNIPGGGPPPPAENDITTLAGDLFVTLAGANLVTL